MSLEITERWLMDAGGWQAMKAARAAWQAGAVGGAIEYDGTRLRGHVRTGNRTLAAGMTIQSKTDVTNLCGCAVSRRDGALCEHTLALGLAWVHRGAGAGSSDCVSAETPRSTAAHSPAASSRLAESRQATPNPASGRAGPSKSPVTPTRGALVVSLPATFLEGLRRQRLALSLRPAPNDTPESDSDRAVHAWLADQGLASLPPQIALSDPQLIESLLFALAGHPRLSAGGKPFELVQGGIRLPLVPAADSRTAESPPTAAAPKGVRLRLALDPAEYGVPLWWIGPVGALVYLPQHYRAHILKTNDLLSPFIDTAGKPQDHTVAITWLARHRTMLSEVFDIDDTHPAWPSIHVLLGQPHFHLTLDGTRKQLTAQLSCTYAAGPKLILPGNNIDGSFPVANPDDTAVFYDRNPVEERRAAARLARSGFTFSQQDNRFIINGEALVLQFFAGDLGTLESEWSVALSDTARAAFRGLERLKPQFREMAAGQDWLSFDLQFVGSAGSTVTAADARRWLQSGQTTQRLPNGKTAVLAREVFQDLEEVLRDINPNQEHGQFRIERRHQAYLESSLARRGENEADKLPTILISNEWQKLLRPYQQSGVHWMLELAQAGWGGILADEMGLGKTVQSLAVVATLRDADPADQAPCLIVAPTSLLGNWKEEAARFAPTLKVLVVRSGERREELARLSAADLVITSYPLLVRDLSHHAAVTYRAVFLDEAGFIRNPETQNAKAVRRLDTGARFALTGTPIENSIRDLWAITDWVIPGYLGTQQDFRERTESPILAGDGRTLARLRRRLAPFWLRRLKEDVARDLPAKIEKIIRCDLTPTQRDIYAAIQREGVRKVEEARRSHTQAQARLTILTALLRLRQTCGDPRLLGESFPNQPPATFSGKWAALAELLAEIRDGGHNVLIFSQFSSQLSLLEDALAEAELDFCRLDGATRDRDAQVAAFQSNPAKRAFLISLKAGGFGLNLTKADTVIHFDPWWNPAVEAQATDRAHRIGQARPVTVYKLIATDTVEEKILDLQRRKRHLLESTLADDTTPLMDSLDDQTLVSLIQA